MLRDRKVRIVIETIPHEKQRYPTAGDWWWEDGTLRIAVSELGDDDLNLLVAIHEMIEAHLCRVDGVSEEEVTAFDMEYEKKGGDGEPGDSEDAPYHDQHRIASDVETFTAGVLCVNWDDYEKKINRLWENQ